MSTNTSDSQQEANFLEDDDAGNNEEANNPIIWSLMSKTQAHITIALLSSRVNHMMS